MTATRRPTPEPPLRVTVLSAREGATHYRVRVWISGGHLGTVRVLKTPTGVPPSLLRRPDAAWLSPQLRAHLDRLEADGLARPVARRLIARAVSHLIRVRFQRQRTVVLGVPGARQSVAATTAALRAHFLIAVARTTPSVLDDLAATGLDVPAEQLDDTLRAWAQRWQLRAPDGEPAAWVVQAARETLALWRAYPSTRRVAAFQLPSAVTWLDAPGEPTLKGPAGARSEAPFLVLARVLFAELSYADAVASWQPALRPEARASTVASSGLSRTTRFAAWKHNAKVARQQEGFRFAAKTVRYECSRLAADLGLMLPNMPRGRRRSTNRVKPNRSS